jgi:hypothetical protein
MGQIYAKASTVHIWLGEEYGLEEQELQAITTVDEIVAESWDMSSEIAPDRPKVQAALCSHAKTKQIDLGALTDILNRAWVSLVLTLSEASHEIDN